MSEALAPLLIRYGRMGDMVLQAPLLQLLHRRYGKPCALLTFGTWTEPLFHGCADVDTIWQLRRRHVPYPLSPQRWALVRALRARTGPVYVSEDIPEHVQRIRALLARAAVPAERCLFLTDVDDGLPVHWVDRLLAFGRLTPTAWPATSYALDAGNAPDAAPKLHLTRTDHDDASSWFVARQLDGKRVVLLQPGNKRTSRRISSRQDEDPKAWPIDRWVELVRAILAHNDDFRVVLCGSVPEHALLDEIKHRAVSVSNSVAVATRDIPIRRLMALAARVHSMIAVDTGPAHVAAAVGCPLVVLYGAESPERWERRSPSGAPVMSLGGPPRLAVRDIGTDEVIAAWKSIARSSRDSGQ